MNAWIGACSPVFMSTRVWYSRVGGMLSKSGTGPSYSQNTHIREVI